MSHTFSISDETYRAIGAIAATRGHSVEELFDEWIASFGHPTTPTWTTVGHDPLARFIGAFETTVPDLLQRHDDYLAEAAADRHDAVS